MKRLNKYSIAVFSIVLLVACGGGGGGGDIVVNADPQGLWKGTNSSSQATVNIAVLENGDSWGIYSNGENILGALYGNATTTGNKILANGKAIDFESTPNSLDVNLTGTVVAKSTMSLTGVGVSIPLVYQPSYETVATTNDISGTWSFDARLVRSGNVNLPPTQNITIDDTGAFSVGNSFCLISGNVTPRPGGKNIYSLTMSVSGFAVCDVPSSMSGIVFIDKSVTPNKFFSLALSPSEDDAVFAMGKKEADN